MFHGALRAGIERRRCLVEDDDRGLDQRSARERDQLPLA